MTTQYDYLKDPILEYLKRAPRDETDSVSIVSYFKVTADLTLMALRALVDEEKVTRVNYGELGGWSRNHHYTVTD